MGVGGDLQHLWQLCRVSDLSGGSRGLIDQGIPAGGILLLDLRRQDNGRSDGGLERHLDGGILRTTLKERPPSGIIGSAPVPDGAVRNAMRDSALADQLGIGSGVPHAFRRKSNGSGKERVGIAELTRSLTRHH